MGNTFFNIPSMSMFNNNWELLLMFMENEGNPPFNFDTTLSLENKDIKTIGSLVSVNGALYLTRSKIETLGGLRNVNGFINLASTPVMDLGDLTVVHRGMRLFNTKIKTLGKLISVGHRLDLGSMPLLESLSNLKSVGDDLFKTYTQFKDDQRRNLYAH